MKEKSFPGLGNKTNTITLNLGLDNYLSCAQQDFAHRANVAFLKLLFALVPSIQFALFSDSAQASVISSYVSAWESSPQSKKESTELVKV